MHPLKESINFIKLKKFLLQVDLLATINTCHQVVKLKELEEKIFSPKFTLSFQ